MRDENMDIIVNNMFTDPEKRKPLTDLQEKLLVQVTDCYNLQLQKPMYSKVSIRNYLMNKYGVSRIQAYRIIEYAGVALGNVQASHKNWIRQRIEYLCEDAYASAKAGNYKLALAINDIAKTLAKSFATNIDEGELINAQKFLEIQKVVITTDPQSININIPHTDQKEIDKLMKKYNIEDVQCEEVNE